MQTEDRACRNVLCGIFTIMLSSGVGGRSGCVLKVLDCLVDWVSDLAHENFISDDDPEIRCELDQEIEAINMAILALRERKDHGE